MRPNRERLIMAAVFSIVAFILADAYVACLMTFPAPLLSHLTDALAAMPSLITGGVAYCMEPAALAAGVTGACAIWLAWAYAFMREGNYRNGEEHGSARWGTRKEGRRFLDGGDAYNNIIFTEHYGMAMSRAAFDLELDRNRNVLVVGGSGSGKTRYYVKPNIMQMNSSIFVTDPKGTMLSETGHMLADAGYRIKVFDSIDFTRSMGYNPLAHIDTQADIYTFVDCLVKNTTPPDSVTNDPFWEKSERLLYMALISYLLDHCPEEDRNLPGLLTLLSLADAHEDDESYMSPLDLLFHEIETGMSYRRVSEEEVAFDAEARGFAEAGGTGYAWVRTGEPTRPEDDFALDNYKAFRSGAGKTLKSIIISCNVRLKPLAIAEVKDVLLHDEMELDLLGEADRRYAVFAIMKDTADTFSFLFALMMWQTIDQLATVALKRHGGSLPTPVHFIFDEFANIGHLPEFEKTIAVVRSRNMSVSILLQSLSQLKSRYKDDAQTIIDCCDTTLFLGGKSNETNKEVSEMVGKETVSILTHNESRGTMRSSTRNWNRQERDLIQASEVGRLPRDQAIVLIAGANPLKDGKYRLEGHGRYALVDPGHPGARYARPFDLTEYRRKGGNRCGATGEMAE